MKKNILIIFLAFTLSLQGQNIFPEVVERFFKENPYNQPFPDFFKALTTDTSAEQLVFQRRTEDKPFHFSGRYKNFSPFRFKPGQVIVTLADVAIDYGPEVTDTALRFDTILFYSISTLTEPGEDGKSTVQKELKWFHRRFGMSFGQSHYEYGGDKENPGYEKYSYAVLPGATRALSVFWNRVEGNDQYAVSVVLLLKIRNNEAGLPYPLD
jgi:hypothetical protein